MPRRLTIRARRLESSLGVTLSNYDGTILRISRKFSAGTFRISVFFTYSGRSPAKAAEHWSGVRERRRRIYVTAQ